MTPSSVQPLSVGNVVSAAFRLYRSHLKQYLGISFKAVLWSLIPIYGWAKLHAYNALISRLAFAELVNQPEPLSEAHNAVKPQLWSFFFAQLLVGLICYGVNILLSVIQAILTSVFSTTLAQQTVVLSLINLALYLLSLVAYFWVYCRLFIPELPLAVENTVSAGDAVGRSWSLTKGYELKLITIITIAGFITLPLIALALIPVIVAIISLSTAFITTALESLDFGFFLRIFLLTMLIFLGVGIITNPFWQAIKAVIYFDLRTRKEGLGLKLRDRDI